MLALRREPGRAGRARRPRSRFHRPRPLRRSPTLLSRRQRPDSLTKRKRPLARRVAAAVGTGRRMTKARHGAAFALAASDFCVLTALFMKLLAEHGEDFKRIAASMPNKVCPGAAGSFDIRSLTRSIDDDTSHVLLQDQSQ